MKTRNIHNSFAKDLRNGKFEFMEDGGLYLPKAKVSIGGVFEHELWRDGSLIDVMSDSNLVVNQGLNHILDVVFSDVTAATDWYVGLFKTDTTPAATDTLATAGWTEIVYSTDVSQTVRPTWNEGGASSQQITNSASKATFDILTTITIYGAFLASVSSGTAGTLMAASKFAASRPVANSDQLLITYTLAASDV